MIRKAVFSDLDAVVNIYDEIHRAEEDGVLFHHLRGDIFAWPGH